MRFCALLDSRKIDGFEPSNRIADPLDRSAAQELRDMEWSIERLGDYDDLLDDLMFDALQ